MAYIDYYKALGVDKSATQDDIKKAFRKLARKYVSNTAFATTCALDTPE